MISCVDVFCGVGGLTYGLARRGISVVAGIDADINCQYPYEVNTQAKFILEDVRVVKPECIVELWPRGTFRMLAGCAPCQPFSTYSRSSRKLEADQKWSLVREFMRLVSECEPDFVTMENVPQLQDHSVFKSLLRTLERYHTWSGVVECAQYGVPQTRKRLVLLASRMAPIQIIPPFIAEKKNFETVRRAISNLRAIQAGQHDSMDRLHAACSLSDINLQRIKASTPGGSWRDWPSGLRATCHKKQSGETFPSVYGRMEWDSPAPTITTQCFGYGNGRFGHPEQDRAISLREAALLQTFPETYEFLPPADIPKFSIQGRLIGNAVPVRLAEAIGESFIQHVVRL